LPERPQPSARQRRDAAGYLEEAFAAYRLEIAGPLLDFDAAVATAAAELLWQACWFLVNREEPEADLDRALAMPGAPRSAAQHLSADLTLRYLPQVHRRAQGLAPEDRLPLRLAQILRQWPLSGVLADPPEAPVSPLDFGGHPGLMLLYAERLAAKHKPGWVPGGKALEFVELVFQEQGKEGVLRLQRESRAHAGVRDEGEKRP
jgi:hypothetical protein